jgi:hypothetical protein
MKPGLLPYASLQMGPRCIAADCRRYVDSWEEARHPHHPPHARSNDALAPILKISASRLSIC